MCQIHDNVQRLSARSPIQNRDRPLTPGSLFDGSGGFPLGALLCGITPIWASEIAPFPIRVTTKRLPQVKHYGDINKMKGDEIEPVDIITFGSPCTNMSVAGKREGLNGAQSVLFYEAIRIIKEMRCVTDGNYPRFIVWENVPGAYSSAAGRDFKEVLSEIVHIKDEGLSVPMPEKDKWLYAGEIVGDGFSVAYRTLDAQFWGVAQRRRRCYLVADFDGERAGEILFESEGLSGYTPQGSSAWQATASNAEGSAGATSGIVLNDHVCGNVPFVIRNPVTAYGICSRGSNAMRSANPNSGIYEADISRTLDRNCCDPRCHQGGVAVVAIQGSMIGRKDTNGPQGNGINDDVCFTLNTIDKHAVAYSLDRSCFNQGQNALYDISIQEEQAQTLVAKGPHAVAHAETEYAVRRLTPQECALLQGFPADWCAGLETPEPTESDIAWWANVFETHRQIVGTAQKAKSRTQIIKWLRDPHTDGAEYTMWGNGISLPCVLFVLSGIAWAMDRP